MELMTTTILTCGRVTWTNILSPTNEDIRQLVDRYPSFHPLNLADCLTELEFPKLDHHDDYLFLVVQFPFWDAKAQISRAAEIDIFITKGVLVTSHRGELKPINEMFSEAQCNEKIRSELMGSGASPLLYHLLNRLVDYCFPIVKKVDEHLRSVEEVLFKKDMRQLLKELALVRRDIIALRRIIHPQLSVVRSLEEGQWHFIHDELDIYWSDINDHLAQLSALLDEHHEVVSGLSDTVDALASHRIDEVVRLLTIVTVVTLPITVLSTIFSMNIILPMSRHPLLFYGLMVLGLALAGIWLRYLHTKNWL